METGGVIEEETARILLYGLWPLPSSQWGSGERGGRGGMEKLEERRWKSGWEVVEIDKAKRC